METQKCAAVGTSNHQRWLQLATACHRPGIVIRMEQLFPHMRWYKQKFNLFILLESHHKITHFSAAVEHMGYVSPGG